MISVKLKTKIIIIIINVFLLIFNDITQSNVNMKINMIFPDKKKLKVT